MGKILNVKLLFTTIVLNVETFVSRIAGLKQKICNKRYILCNFRQKSRVRVLMTLTPVQERNNEHETLLTLARGFGYCQVGERVSTVVIVLNCLVKVNRFPKTKFQTKNFPFFYLFVYSMYIG